MTTPQTIIAALAVVGVRCSQETAELVLMEHRKRDAIIGTIVGSQALSGVDMDRDMVAASVDRAYAKPRIVL